MSKIKKFKQKIVGAFIGTGGKEKDKERTEFIDEINKFNKTICEYKDIDIQKIINDSNCFIEKLKFFLNKRIHESNKSNSYKAINDIVSGIGDITSPGVNKINGGFLYLSTFYAKITEFLDRCTRAPKYSLIAGPAVKKSVESLKKSFGIVYDNAVRQRTLNYYLKEILDEITTVFEKYSLENLESKQDYKNTTKKIYNLFNGICETDLITYINKFEGIKAKNTFKDIKIDELNENTDLDMCKAYVSKLKSCIENFFENICSQKFLDKVKNTFPDHKFNQNIYKLKEKYNRIINNISNLIKYNGDYTKIEEEKSKIIEKTNDFFVNDTKLLNLIESINLENHTIDEFKKNLKDLHDHINSQLVCLINYYEKLHNFLIKLCKKIINLSNSQNLSLDNVKNLNVTDFEGIINLKFEKIDGVNDKYINNIKEFLNKLQNKIILAKNKFTNLVKEQKATDQTHKVINKLIKTKFYDDICNKNYNKTKWFGLANDGLDSHRFINDVIAQSLIISDAIKVTKIENLTSFENVNKIFKELTQKLKEFEPNNLSSRENLKKSIENIINISNQIKNENTKKLIDECVKKFSESYSKLLEKINIFGNQLNDIKIDTSIYINSVLKKMLETPKNINLIDIINRNTRTNICDKIQKNMKKFKTSVLSAKDNINFDEYETMCKKFTSANESINCICTKIKNTDKIELSELIQIYEKINNIFTIMNNLIKKVDNKNIDPNNIKKIENIVKSSGLSLNNFKSEKKSLKDIENYSKNTIAIFKNLWYLKTYFIAQDKILSEENIEKFKDLWVIDDNCISGMFGNNNVRKGFIDNKDNNSWKNEHNILNGPQKVSEVVSSGLKVQYTHSKMFGVGGNPYYVLTNNNGIIDYIDNYPYQSGENSCINLSGNNETALQEVTNYLKKVVEYGRFQLDIDEAKAWINSK